MAPSIRGAVTDLAINYSLAMPVGAAAVLTVAKRSGINPESGGSMRP